MTLRRVLLQIGVVLVAILVQVDILDRLDLPGGHPDLLVVCVVAFALVGGRQRGAVIGFGIGLAADLLPPADHYAGRLAFAYTIVGYVAGMLDDVEERSVLITILAVGGGAAVAVLCYAGLGSLIGDVSVTPGSTVHSLVITVVYDVILAPFVVPLVSTAARRLEPTGPR